MSLADHLGRVGRDVVLELLQLLAQRDAHQVGPRAEQLAQLDERRPQFGQGQSQAGFPGMPGNGRPARAFSKSLAKSGPSRPIQAASSYLLSTARISYQRFRWR